MKKFVTSAIRFYQRQISPLSPPRCRYIPTCSEYALEAVEKYGAVKGSWLAAKRILLVASGAGKADAVYKMVCGPITPECPASILQLHPDVTVVVDEAAAARLMEAGVSVCG